MVFYLNGMTEERIWGVLSYHSALVLRERRWTTEQMPVIGTHGPNDEVKPEVGDPQHS